VAVAEVLKSRDERVAELFVEFPEALQAAEDKRELRESEILQTANVDFSWTARCGCSHVLGGRGGGGSDAISDQDWTLAVDAGRAYIGNWAYGCGAVAFRYDLGLLSCSSSHQAACGAWAGSGRGCSMSC
jgi:hypothetical protein